MYNANEEVLKMNYPEIKEKVSKELDQILIDYKRMLYKVLSLNNKILDLYEKSVNEDHIEDLVNFVEKDERMKRLTSLTISLMYVENPSNEEIIQKLLDDIQLNLEELNNKR